LTEPDTVCREFVGQPIVAIDKHLHAHWKPRLDHHMDQAKFSIHEVVVNMQALTFSTVDKRTTLLEPKREGLTGLHLRKHAHQTLFNTVRPRDLLGALFFPRTGSGQINVGSPRLLCHALGMRLQHRRMAGQKGFQVAELDPLLIQKLGHGRAGHDREIATK
jgi:hypothetical protein